MKQKDFVGLCWHVHHDKLLEFCHSYAERKRYILTSKPKTEQALRLRLFQPVKGVLPQKLIKARQARDQAWQAYLQAWQAYDKAEQAYVKAQQAYVNKAQQAYDRAEQAYAKAGQAYDKVMEKHANAIEALHKTECLDCPWNGETIFV